MRFQWEGGELEIGAFLFDKDGTLLDSLSPWAAVERELVSRLLSRRGFSGEALASASSRLLTLLGIEPAGVDRTGLLACGTEQAILAALEGGIAGGLQPALSGREAPSRAFRAEAGALLEGIIGGKSPESPAMDGAVEVLSLLEAQGLPLGLVTADSTAPTLADLERLGWQDRFRFIATGDGEWKAKPDPAAVLAFARQEGLATARLAIVGDTEIDAELARRAGAGLFIRVEKSLRPLVPRLTRGLPFSTIDHYGCEYPPIEIHRIF